MRQQMQQVIDRLPDVRVAYSPNEAGELGLGPPDPREFKEFQELQEFPGRISPAESQISGISVASTTRFPSAVHKSLHYIRQATQALHNLEGQGSKLIAANLVELRYTRKELDAGVKAAERQGIFPETVRAEVEDILEATTREPRLSGWMNWKLGRKTK